MANPTENNPAIKTLDIKGLYKRLFKYSWKYKYVLFLSVIALVILSLTNTAFLVIIKKITDQGFINQSEHRRLSLALMLFGVMFARAFSGLVSGYSMDWVSTKVVEGLRCDAFKRIMHFPISYFDKHSSSFIVSKITYDAEQLSNVATKITLTLIKDGLTIVGIISYMLYLDWQLTLIFSLLAPLMAVYLSAMSPRLRSAGKTVQETMGKMTMASDEAISGQRIVKIFGSSQYEILRFSKITAKIRQTHNKLSRLYSLNSLTVELLAAIALSSIVFYSFGKFTAGEFAAFFGALLMLIAPIKNLTAVNDRNQVGLSAAQSVFGLIDQELELNTGTKIIKRAKGNIRFYDVFFKYENAKVDILKNINLNILIGPEGDFSNEESNSFNFRVESNNKENAVRVDGATDRVLILSGGAGASYDEASGLDVSFYVSGSRNSAGTSNKGTSVFGGDTVVSGSAFTGLLTVEATDPTITFKEAGVEKGVIGINSSDNIILNSVILSSMLK